MRPNFDIKKQTESAERLFTSMLDTMDQSHTFVFNDCLPMCGITRKRSVFKKLICKNHVSPVYNVIMFFRGEVLCQVTSKTFSASTEDIAILSNSTCPQTDSLDNSWTPIWLPSHAEMLHILTVDLKDFGCKMIMISDRIDACPECTKMAEAALKDFKDAGLQEQIQGIKQFKPTGVLHWIVCNKKLLQVHAPYIQDSQLSRIIYRAYSWTAETLEEHPTKGIFYIASEQITIVGKQTQSEISMIALNVGITAADAQKIYAQFEEYFSKNRDVFFDNEQTFFDEK